ncbi:hypothetical protein [Dactylosporangium sp. NPDC049140]|uniref:hypothetical protein n=1 Tax=Dactylosporangium sp. NPDC049140 TaxID=3155647 RepID=UPI0033C9AADB
MIELGTSATLMDAQMGHADGSVQALYAHVTAGMVRRLLDRLTEICRGRWRRGGCWIRAHRLPCLIGCCGRRGHREVDGPGKIFSRNSPECPARSSSAVHALTVRVQDEVHGALGAD